jgi:hypothetical protein
VRMQCESDRIVQNVEGTWLLAWRTWPGVVEMRVDIPRAALRVEQSVLRASMTGRGLAHLGAETTGCVPTILPYLVNRKTAHVVVLRVIPRDGAVHLSLVYFMYVLSLVDTCRAVGSVHLYRYWPLVRLQTPSKCDKMARNRLSSRVFLLLHDWHIPDSDFV